MFEVLSQAALMLLCGAAWRFAGVPGADSESTRRVLTSLVYYLLLPTLVLQVMWKTPINLDSLRISLSALAGLALTAPLSWFIYRRLLRQPNPVTGAMVLAAVFPNVTYLGLPVLESVYGPWARSVAIQYDLFACTPLLLSLGILFARRLGENSGKTEPALLTLTKVPALWAALCGALLSANHLEPPAWVLLLLDMPARAVVPLMLLSLGMSLRWERTAWRRIPLTFPVLLLQLVIMPLLVERAAFWLGLRGELLGAVVLEAAMPSMVLGIVLCDRYRLDSALYACAVTLSTFAALFTLPLCFAWIS